MTAEGVTPKERRYSLLISVPPDAVVDIIIVPAFVSVDLSLRSRS
jgi:hypothetical protein